MRVLVSDTSILIDLERADLLQASFSLDAEFVVPDLLYERELRDSGELIYLRWVCVLNHWMRAKSSARRHIGAIILGCHFQIRLH